MTNRHIEVRAISGALGAEVGKDPERMALAAVYPAVRSPPESGRKALSINRAHTLRCTDMTAEESAPLLEFLFEHLVRAEHTCRFRWQPGPC